MREFQGTVRSPKIRQDKLHMDGFKHGWVQTQDDDSF